MTRHSLYNAVAISAMLLASCASSESIAQGADSPTEIDLENLGSLPVTENKDTELPYKILGMPDEIDGTSVLLNWPNSGVAVEFEGSQLLATIDGNNDTFIDIQINDVLKTIQLNDGRFTYRLIDAMPGEYNVSLQIRTDRAYRPIRFEGFVTEDGALTTPPRSELQMLVIGDDVAAGYGVEGEDQFCDYTRETQNANLSFANVSAQNLGADVAVIARSGRGLAVNWNNDPSANMTALYRSAMESDASSALGNMDIVVVQLGGIDIAQSDPGPDFYEKYAGFLDEIRQDHPYAEIVAAWGPMGSGERYQEAKTAITELVAERATQGDQQVSFIEFTNTEFGQLYGCNWHPSIDTQRFMASELTRHLAARMSLDLDVETLLLGG